MDLMLRTKASAGDKLLSKFEFGIIKALLQALGRKNDVLSFDSKLLCLSSTILAPIITKFANESINTIENCQDSHRSIRERET